ncbi:Hypothetical protein CAP_6133 [Chondromyces apiculatus DSM 436]|uniref:Uncharacterized protein n=1 Tax=Chondromyces apiculatus DSM 436 TaxID=1192034 RepID=A0A017T2F5_9BACT|nr:Hypothetical protein CAP_6133 [Chondromyces apiculatus DSM 436]
MIPTAGARAPAPRRAKLVGAPHAAIHPQFPERFAASGLTPVASGSGHCPRPYG